MSNQIYEMNQQMQKNYFTIRELCIDPNRKPPQDVVNKLKEHHINPMNIVRECLGVPVWASQRSGWRPYEWEIARGRSGNSHHVFKELGAIDWTSSNLKNLFNAILKHTPYTRIAVYPDANFIHCDYGSNTRVIFISDNSSNWKVSSEKAVNKILK